MPTYRYRYRAIFPLLQAYPWLRSYHGADVFILFGHTFTTSSNNTGEYFFIPFPSDSLEHQASISLQSAFATFITDPSKGLLDQLEWPLYSPNCKRYTHTPPTPRRLFILSGLDQIPNEKIDCVTATTKTLIETFKDNQIGVEFTDSRWYDKVCENIPIFTGEEELTRRPPPLRSVL